MDELLKEIENMSEQEKAQLLAVDFGADLEKEANAELASGDLAEALFAYGAHMAVREIESTEDLSKEASAELEEEYKVITEAIEQGLAETGILDNEDTVELHKEAQAAAGIIFAGYSDAIEKLANEEAKEGKVKKFLHKTKKAMGEAGEKAKEHAGKFGKHLAKHKGKYGGGAAALAAGVGALAYKKHHEKKASEISASELADIMNEDQAVDTVVFEGIDKLAAAGKKAVSEGLLAKATSLGKSALKHKKAIGGGAAAGAGGFALGRMSKHKKD